MCHVTCTHRPGPILTRNVQTWTHFPFAHLPSLALHTGCHVWQGQASAQLSLPSSAQHWRRRLRGWGHLQADHRPGQPVKPLQQPALEHCPVTGTGTQFSNHPTGRAPGGGLLLNWSADLTSTAGRTSGQTSQSKPCSSLATHRPATSAYTQQQQRLHIATSLTAHGARLRTAPCTCMQDCVHAQQITHPKISTVQVHVNHTKHAIHSIIISLSPTCFCIQAIHTLNSVCRPAESAFTVHTQHGVYAGDETRWRARACLPSRK